MFAPKSYKLSFEEIHKFHDQGYLGPFAGYSPEEVAVYRKKIDREVLTTEGPNKGNRTHARHIDSRAGYDICAYPAIMDRVVSLCGLDIILWGSNFLNKLANKSGKLFSISAAANSRSGGGMTIRTNIRHGSTGEISIRP